MDKGTLAIICGIVGFLLLAAGPLGILIAVALFTWSSFLMDEDREDQRKPHPKDGNKDVDLFN